MDGPPTPSAQHVARDAVQFTRQAEKPALEHPGGTSPSVAAQARFVSSDGSRLPGVPPQEAHRLDVLRQGHEAKPQTVDMQQDEPEESMSRAANDGPQEHGVHVPEQQDGTLQHSTPPSRTHPLFPPLPLYGPPSALRYVQCLFFRVSSSLLSLAFLAIIVAGALVTSVPTLANYVLHKMTLRDMDEARPFHEGERRRADLRKQERTAWKRRASVGKLGADKEETADVYPPTEGGKDPMVCDVGHYARRVGLDVDKFKVQTDDGFIIDLWHVYDPKEYTEPDEHSRNQAKAAPRRPTRQLKDPDKKPKFPVLLMHGLLQSSGAYCCNDDDSLAFWLCKSGFDVWLGNNRCGFQPQHAVLDHDDPHMWCWNIRHMGVLDLPALTSRVLSETGFEKLGLICHSQGTTETFVALAKEQRPELGDKLTVFCALAPAAYAGPLIGKMYFKFMRIISPAMFSIMFGIHAFIPFMMQMHGLLPPRVYGWLGYKVFSFLFDWSDRRWDRGLRDRMFQFAPVYVSAESMRWWLGREGFAKHKCILATKEVTQAEEELDGLGGHDDSRAGSPGPGRQPGATAWYDGRAPPFALWVCGDDDLVDGRRLLRRFERGREPHVRVVHSRVIEGYEHLDVIWAMDAVDQVFKEVREVLWKTCNARDVCRVPAGCDEVGAWDPAEGVGEKQLVGEKPLVGDDGSGL